MKRRDLLHHLVRHVCVEVREGGRHSWWLNPEKTCDPRHREINEILVRKICKDLGVEPLQ